MPESQEGVVEIGLEPLGSLSLNSLGALCGEERGVAGGTRVKALTPAVVIEIPEGDHLAPRCPESWVGHSFFVKEAETVTVNVQLEILSGEGVKAVHGVSDRCATLTVTSLDVVETT